LTVKPEQKLFQDLKKQLEKAKKQIHFVRVENLIEQGTPDLNCCYEGVEFWLELKADDGRIPRLSKYQIAWHYRRQQRTQKDERLKLFEGSGTGDVGTWSPVMELPFPLPASRHNSPVPASRSVFPFVEIFDFIKNKHRL
jgi:hypothetical protein